MASKNSKGHLILCGILLCLFLVILGCDPDPEPRGVVRSEEDSKEREAEAALQWDMINFVDEFGDVTDRGAVSALAKPIRPMSFPYGDMTARIMVNCDHAWLRFSQTPNITGGETLSGYDRYSVAIRVDGNSVGRWLMDQSWGAKDLSFVDGSHAISALSSGSTFAVAAPWYGQGSVAFSWSLGGSSEMIRNSCD